MPAARLPIAIALLVLVAPSAAAQLPLLEMTITAAPFEGPIMPLGEVSTTDVTARVPCALLRGESGVLRWWTDPTPPWLVDVVFSPAESRIDLASCPPEGALITATLAARANAAAPAFVVEPLSVRASLESGGTNATGAADIGVEAEYFAILDVALEQSIQVGRPGARLVYPVTFTNLGNGATLVTPSLVEAGEGLTVELFEAFTLDPRSSRTVGVIVTTTESGFGYVNRVDAATVRIVGEHAGGRGNDTDETTISLAVTTKGFDTPAPATPVVLALVALAAYSRRVLRR